MAMDIDALLEGGPSYGVIDAKDGFLLYGREGHEADFRALTAEVEASADGFEIIPLDTPGDSPDRLFIAPLAEAKSFSPPRGLEVQQRRIAALGGDIVADGLLRSITDQAVGPAGLGTCA